MEEKHGFDFDDLKNAFEKHSRFGWDIAVHRLSQCHVTEGDPGYETLLERPPFLDEMRSFFSKGIRDLEIKRIASDMMGDIPEKIDVHPMRISHVIRGDRPITVDLAMRFSNKLV